MFKKFIIAFLLVDFLIMVGWFWQNRSLVTDPVPSPTPLSTKSSTSESTLLGLVKNEEALLPVTVGDKTYRMAWFAVQPSVQITIGVNTKLASGSSELAEANTCKILTSGGFYTSDGKPIGMVVSNGKEISPWQKNQLLNGVLGSQDGQVVIVKGDIDDTLFDWAIQAGPVLWASQSAVPLSLKADQPARRILAGRTTDGQLILMAVVANDSLFSGPYLADMQTVIPALSKIVGKEFESVINLDGGTASAFVSDTVSLRELKPIGSYVCGK